jgi:nucleoside-diphosphate-sugar epimerase
MLSSRGLLAAAAACQPAAEIWHIEEISRMRVVMIGGTGYLGYFTTRELLDRGHDVVAVGLADPVPGSMPDGVEIVRLDTDAADEAALAGLLKGADAVIHAAGADGRFSGPAPVVAEYRRRNVEPVARLVAAMHGAGAGRLVILGSYYTALARSAPHLIDLPRNPYPLSRAEQADAAFRLAGDAIDVAVLELPYIFGAAPQRGSLWGYLMDQLAADGPVEVPAGGTACVTAAQVGKAAAAACEVTRGKRNFPICSENLTYREIYGFFAAAMGRNPAFVTTDAAKAAAAAEANRSRMAAAGIETGYDAADVVRWQAAHLYLDPLPARQVLRFGEDDLGRAIADTVSATRAFGGQGPASISSAKATANG